MPQRSSVISLSAVGFSNPLVINLNQFRGGVGIICTWQPVGGATVVYDVQVTGQQVNFGTGPANPAVAPTIWNFLDNMQGLTVSKNGSLAYPCTAVRLSVDTLVGAGTVTLAVVQVMQ